MFTAPGFTWKQEAADNKDLRVATTMNPDFFTKFASMTAIIGFGLFIAFGLAAALLYPFPFSLLADPYSKVGAIVTGNYAAGMLSAGLAVTGAFMIPVVVAFLRETVDHGKGRRMPVVSIGFIMQLAGRAGMILVGVFPTRPWKGIHDAVAITWMAGEVLGMIFIMIEMFRWPTERKWVLVATLVIVAGIVSWLPYAFGTWEGMGMSEFITMLTIYAYSLGLWVRAWKHGAAIGQS